MKLIHSILFSIFFFATTSLTAQIAYDLTTAKALALSENKLIIMDFGASWCMPCGRMEYELWNSEEFTALADRFILLKIDVTEQRELASRYHVQSIPRVIITAADEKRLYDNTGFISAEAYLKVFRSFPSNFQRLNEYYLRTVNPESITAENLYALSNQWSVLAQAASSKAIKKAFLNGSDDYLKWAEKIVIDESQRQLLTLAQLRNAAYQGKYKKAMKKLAKTSIDPKDEQLVELKNFILAYCYSQTGEVDKFSSLTKQISDDGLKSELNQLAIIN